MQRRYTIVKKILAICLLIVGLSRGSSEAYAASGTIGVSPSSGPVYTVGKPFSVDLVIDGHGEAFNAAKVTVKVSASAHIDNLILGDCTFSFIQTPTTTNPSFVGVILGGSSKKCTVYTLVLNPTEQTTTIDITDAGLKKYGDAADILGSVQNGIYTKNNASSNIVSALVEHMQNLSGNQPAPTPQPTMQPAQPNQGQTLPPSSYTLALNVLASDNQPLSGATAIIDPSEYTTTNQQRTITATTDNKGAVQFTNIAPGIHILKVAFHGQPIAEKMINVSGNNPVLTLGMQQQKQPMEWTLLLLMSIPVLILILYLGHHFGILGKRKHAL